MVQVLDNGGLSSNGTVLLGKDARHRQVSRERGLVEPGWSGKRGMTTPRDPIYAGHRYPAEVISYAVWLYLRFPLSLRMVEEMLAACGISALS
jgi:hypothetical protein